jgi:hypothetical protein
MTRMMRVLLLTGIVAIALLMLACESGGIGVGLPASGARWGGGASGPGVLVGGGPAY